MASRRGKGDSASPADSDSPLVPLGCQLLTGAQPSSPCLGSTRAMVGAAGAAVLTSLQDGGKILSQECRQGA